jgi:aryl sulfotransferase
MQPQLLHVYQNYIQDSARWAQFSPRDNDIVISTSPKTGTTWTQAIVLNLIFLGQEVPYQSEVSPWLDMRLQPLDDVINLIENQRHRRLIKAHLPLDGLPFFPQLKYIALGRDPRDVFMSMWNHYASSTPDFIAYMNNVPGLHGAPLSPAPADIHDFWQPWISRGQVEWEQEGFPFFGPMHHFQSWWNFRHLPNILLVHYADTLADPAEQIRRIASFLDIIVTDEQIERIVQQTNISAMRTRAEEKEPGLAKVWVDGARSFFFKGTNGRWKDVLTDEELAMYEDTASKVLTPDCRAWLEQGIVATAA